MNAEIQKKILTELNLIKVRETEEGPIVERVTANGCLEVKKTEIIGEPAIAFCHRLLSDSLYEDELDFIHSLAKKYYLSEKYRYNHQDHRLYLILW